jgi:hypothetical protein
MHAYVNIGANQELKLAEAVLVYRSGGDGASQACTRSSKMRMGLLILPLVKP